MTDFRDEMTLGEARDAMRDLVEEGHNCPVCTQFAKVYRRRIHATMARELIAFWREAGRDWCYLPDSVVARGGDMVKVRYWGMIEEDDGVREDGSKRTGWWRVTELGERWILGRATVPMYARIYNGRRLGLVGQPVNIRDALGRKFDYGELMALSVIGRS